MKKLLAIIVILLAVFIGMYINKSKTNKNTVLATEVQNIQEYISKIYLWQEVTGDALPKFENINEASETWIWEVVKKNLENYELSYEEIQSKAKEIFGEDFNKQFPQEGTEFIQYNSEIKKYLAVGMGLDTDEDLFIINNIEKTDSGYKVEIIEYLEDYSDSMNMNEEQDLDENSEVVYNVYIKNINGEKIETIKSTDGETKAIDIVKKNIDKFSTKMIYLDLVENKLYIKSVK